MTRLRKRLSIFFSVVSLCALGSVYVPAAHGNACSEGVAYPPFLAEGVDPNLLMIIDNSASMYDMAYVPEVASQQGYCYDDSYILSTAAAPAWANGAVYAAGAMVSSGGSMYRTAAGGTASGTSVADDTGVTDWEEVPSGYVGYFDTGQWYVYDAGDDEFEVTSSASADCNAAAGTKYSNVDLCIKIDETATPKQVEYFAASGRFLNWAASSKFDIEKKVLTGGKHDGSHLILESRGCMNKTFIKQTAVTDSGGATSYLTLGVIAENDALSTNLTKIEIYAVTAGGFQADDCQKAIDEFADPGGGSLGTIKSLTTSCLGTGAGMASHTAFNHIMQECWYFNKHGNFQPGSGTVNSMKNDCEDVYNAKNPPKPPTPDEATYIAQYAPDAQKAVDICYGVYGSSQGYVGRCWEPTYAAGSGTVCTPDACTPGTDVPTENLVDPGSDTHASPFCNSGSSTWYYCNGNYNASKGTCKGSPGRWEVKETCGPVVGGSTISSVDWTDDAPGNYTESGLFTDADDCVDQSIRKYCGNVVDPEVVDPTDAMSASGTTYNVPAILMDSAIDSQLGDPLISMKGLVQVNTTPTGLLHDYQNEIRMGSMAFNAGSYSECASIEKPVGSGRYVANMYDCLLDKGLAITAASAPDPAQRDGAHIVNYIGKGATHFDQLVTGINNIAADAWTPTAEAYFNAIGFYTQNTGLRFDASDCIMDQDFASYPAWASNTVYGADAIVHDFMTNKLYITYDGGTSSQFLPDGATPATELSHDTAVLWQPIDPVTAYCQKNNILILTDGASTADQHADMVSLANSGAAQDEGAADAPYGCGSLTGSTLLDDLAYYAYNASIYPSANFLDENNLPVTGDNIKLYIVATGTLRSNVTNPAECDSESQLTEAAENGYDLDASSNPLGQLYKAENPERLEEELRKVFNDIRAGLASGSASSVISSSRSGEGAVYQAIFWPRFASETVTWIGDVHSLQVGAAGVMHEDTNGNRTFDPAVDEEVVLFFDENLGRTRACNGGIDPTTGACLGTTKEINEVHYLWSAAEWLSEVAPNPSSANFDIISNRGAYISNERKRLVYFWNDLDNDGIVDGAEAMPFESGTDWENLAVDASRAPVPLDFGVDSNAEVDAIIEWIRGLDDPANPALRSRQRNFSFDPDWDWAIDPTPPAITWRLADVVHSTPMTVTRPQENFHNIYRDRSYAPFAARHNKRRHMIYFGSNGGTLHGVNGGFYDETAKTFCLTEDCRIENSGGTLTAVGEDVPELGAEMWAYVPYNLLPHLKCLMDPNYKHKFYVDLRPRIFDAKIFDAEAACAANPLDAACIHPNGWGTIMVVGMKFGGAPIDANTIDGDGDGAADMAADNRKFVSSYIIFDITNPEASPVLLGELTANASTANMGYTTAIPTIASMKDSTDQYWYLIMGSGPTDTDGTSGQPAKVAVFPLADLNPSSPGAFRIPEGAPAAGNEVGRFELTDGNSFTTGMVASDFDLVSRNPEYKTDAVYFGTVSGGWGNWGGKLYRLITRDVDANNIQLLRLPHEWSSIVNPNPKVLFNAGKPITGDPSSGTDIYDNKWVYFGTGRFLHRNDKLDFSSNALQSFYGIKEPRHWVSGAGCEGFFTWDEVEIPSTAPATDPGDLGLEKVDGISVEAGTGNLTPNAPSGAATFDDLKSYILGDTAHCAGGANHGTDGWYRDFTATGHERERSLGKSLIMGGLVIFTTYQPFENICLPEGLSYMYGLDFATGTAYKEPVFDDDYTKPVEDHKKLGRGLSVRPNLHAGDELSAFAQTSTGAIVKIAVPNPPAGSSSVTTGRDFWKELD